MSAPFNCLRALDELQDWLSNESTPENATLLEAHLAACDPCRTHKEFEVRFRELLRRATAMGSCPPETKARLLAALRRETGR